jgi:hypothetical protein
VFSQPPFSPDTPRQLLPPRIGDDTAFNCFIYFVLEARQRRPPRRAPSEELVWVVTAAVVGQGRLVRTVSPDAGDAAGSVLRKVRR